MARKTWKTFNGTSAVFLRKKISTEPYPLVNLRPTTKSNISQTSTQPCTSPPPPRTAQQTFPRRAYHGGYFSSLFIIYFISFRFSFFFCTIIISPMWLSRPLTGSKLFRVLATRSEIFPSGVSPIIYVQRSRVTPDTQFNLSRWTVYIYIFYIYV